MVTTAAATAINPYEVSARFQKATKLHRLLQEYGLIGDVRRMRSEHWRMLATAAGVHPPSEETIRLVVELCEEW